MSQQHKKTEAPKKGFVSWYKQHYKMFLFIPLVLFIISLGFVVKVFIQEGTPIYRDISLKGGLSASVFVSSSVSISEFENALAKQFPQGEFAVSELSNKNERSGFLIETNVDEKQLISFLNSYFKVAFESGKNYSSNFISSTLSSSFFEQAALILLISFALMSIVIFIAFKEFVPSGLVVLSAIFDILGTIGILNMLHHPVSVAGIGALLMLIGYSVDTDVLLTNRLIKEKDSHTSYWDKFFTAFKTGQLMLTTTFVACSGAYLLSNSAVIKEIALIIIIGLVIDSISTWIQNAGMLMWWLEKKGEKLD